MHVEAIGEIFVLSAPLIFCFLSLYNQHFVSARFFFKKIITTHFVFHCMLKMPCKTYRPTPDANMNLLGAGVYYVNGILDAG